MRRSATHAFVITVQVPLTDKWKIASARDSENDVGVEDNTANRKTSLLCTSGLGKTSGERKSLPDADLMGCAHANNENIRPMLRIMCRVLVCLLQRTRDTIGANLFSFAYGAVGARAHIVRANGCETGLNLRGTAWIV